MAYEAYITETDYAGIYKGQTIDSAKFARFALRASDELDKITFNRVRRAGLAGYDADVQEAIKLATCALAEALSLKDEATEGTGIITTSEKVGPYNYSIDAQSVEKLWSDALKLSRKYLLQTGLLYRGI